MAAAWIEIFHLKSRKAADKDMSPDRKSKLEFLHFKAVCFQRASSNLFWTYSSFLHAQDKCVYVLVGGLKMSQSSRFFFFYPFCCFMWLSWNRKPKASSRASVAGPATRCWHQCWNNEPIQRKWRALYLKKNWACKRSLCAGGKTSAWDCSCSPVCTIWRTPTADLN